MAILTVQELIDQLSAQPRDLPVLTEGCDCTGQVSGVRMETACWIEEKPKYILIARIGGKHGRLTCR